MSRLERERVYQTDASPSASLGDAAVFAIFRRHRSCHYFCSSFLLLSACSQPALSRRVCCSLQPTRWLYYGSSKKTSQLATQRPAGKLSKHRRRIRRYENRRALRMSDRKASTTHHHVSDVKSNQVNTEQQRIKILSGYSVRTYCANSETLLTVSSSRYQVVGHGTAEPHWLWESIFPAELWDRSRPFVISNGCASTHHQLCTVQQTESYFDHCRLTELTKR